MPSLKSSVLFTDVLLDVLCEPHETFPTIIQKWIIVGNVISERKILFINVTADRSPWVRTQWSVVSIVEEKNTLRMFWGLTIIIDERCFAYFIHYYIVSTSNDRRYYCTWPTEKKNRRDVPSHYLFHCIVSETKSFHTIWQLSS